MRRLRERLRQIDGRGYGAYKSLRGRYWIDDIELEVTHVQGDPFAAPSRLTLRLPLSALPLQLEDSRPASRRLGYEDALLRSLRAVLPAGRKGGGTGKSGEWGIVRPGQEILARTACTIEADRLVVRLTLGLPARGRRVLGRQAERLLLEDLPLLVERGLRQADAVRLKDQADANEDQDALRSQLAERGWLAFVADGSILPRRSGVDDRPLVDGAVPWRSPPALEATVELPNGGRLSGTAIPEGVTLICGGGYHGKSTLLAALSRGIYNHVPGDGREHCASIYDAVNVRAEDGRRVERVDIRAFIGELPSGRTTDAFCSENASGSTSQAANIVEALELGARCLLIDEDTSATNFMVRDRRMQELVATDREPITPFVDRVRELYETLGVSTVLVVGGSGDYFEVADQVLVMNAYRPILATERARSIAASHPSERLREPRDPLVAPNPRVPLAHSLDARRGKRSESARARQTRTISFGTSDIDVALVAQLIDDGQTRTLADWLLACSRALADDQTDLATICRRLEQSARRDGLVETTAPDFGDRAMARRYELAAAINRLRTLRIADA